MGYVESKNKVYVAGIYQIIRVQDGWGIQERKTVQAAVYSPMEGEVYPTKDMAIDRCEELLKER